MRTAATITGSFWPEPLLASELPSLLAPWSGCRWQPTLRWSSFRSRPPSLLVIGSPDAEPAQPRALNGGHVVATLVGLAVLQLTGPNARAAAAAVGLAILAMYVTGTFHPPAGINPLLVISNNLSWSFLFAPVLAGVLLLTAFGYVWHRWIRRRPWPQRWL